MLDTAKSYATMDTVNEVDAVAARISPFKARIIKGAKSVGSAIVSLYTFVDTKTTWRGIMFYLVLISAAFAAYYYRHELKAAFARLRNKQ